MQLQIVTKLLIPRRRPKIYSCCKWLSKAPGNLPNMHMQVSSSNFPQQCAEYDASYIEYYAVIVQARNQGIRFGAIPFQLKYDTP